MTSVTYAAIVTVRCECGDVFDMTQRSYRRHHRQGTMWRCAICRRKSIQISPSRYSNYWLDRYSIEWIKETAAMIWDDD